MLCGLGPHVHGGAVASWGGRKVARLRAEVIAEYGRTCILCGEWIPVYEPVSVEHLTPRSRGGGDELWNLRPAHESCNKVRQDRPLTAHVLEQIKAARGRARRRVRKLPKPSREW